MAAPENRRNGQTEASNRAATIWLGIAVGAAVGIGIALSRHKKSRWEVARTITNRVAERSGDFADVTRELFGRVRNIYEESCKVVEDANHLWAHGRKLVRS
jgi:hypothetical protein